MMMTNNGSTHPLFINPTLKLIDLQNKKLIDASVMTRFPYTKRHLNIPFLSLYKTQKQLLCFSPSQIEEKCRSYFSLTN